MYLATPTPADYLRASLDYLFDVSTGHEIIKVFSKNYKSIAVNSILVISAVAALALKVRSVRNYKWLNSRTFTYAGHDYSWPTGKLREVGSGGFLTVYKFQSIDKTQSCAVGEVKKRKKFSFQNICMESTQRASERFENSSTLISVKIFKKTNKRPLLQVMPLMEGNIKTLSEGGNLSMDDKKSIAIQMIQAVADVHWLDCAHMDIKPANFLYKRSGGYKVLLGDFGCVQIGDWDTKLGALMIGTWAYEAPEVEAGKVTNLLKAQKVDLYSLGCCICQLYTKQLPRIEYGSLANKDSFPDEVYSLVKDLIKSNPEERPSAISALGRIRFRNSFSASLFSLYSAVGKFFY